MKTIFLFLFVNLSLLLIGCANQSDKFSRIGIIPGEQVILMHENLELRFDRQMYCSVLFNKEGKVLSINSENASENQSLPSFYIVADSTVRKNFTLDFDHIRITEIMNDLGTGQSITLSGKSNDLSDVEIEKILSIEFYTDFPDMAIISAEYKNLTPDRTIRMDEVYNNCYQADATLVNDQLNPHAFYSFYGNAGRPFSQIEDMIPDEFQSENFLGRTEKLEGVKEGNGGIPVVDIWCREMGLGIGHIETKWQNAFLPMTVTPDGKVFMAVKEIPNMNFKEPFFLGPGDTYRTIKTFVKVHSLDFYPVLSAYSALMKKQGIDMQTKSTANDYLSAWCTWNDFSTSAMASKKDVMLIAPVLERLEALKAMTISEIIFDAGWFNNQGDWMPNTDPLTFPGGEADLITAIDKIHQNGLKVKLWISFLTADPWSEVSLQHPEWMIKKPDGDFHLDRWSGYTMCPALPEVQNYHSELARRFVDAYGADGFKVDGMYVCPPCYNPAHGHTDPNESSQAYHKVFKAFYDKAKSINRNVTIMSCPCGTICDYTSLPYITETIAADPESRESVRRNAKIYRALKGANTPYSSDYIDLPEGNLTFPAALANAVGIGAVPQTFYGAEPTAQIKEVYKKWFSIYSREMISQANYLPLYDMKYDKPETHVFEKTVDEKQVFYFSFFADESQWDDEVVFRGLDGSKTYTVYDYVNEKVLGEISGKSPRIHLSFSDYLLVKCNEQ